jgi:2-polyprenyl-3-methyl-5-hydroxy-6-metoxy-1,4-benzoquinol methylase
MVHMVLIAAVPHRKPGVILSSLKSRIGSRLNARDGAATMGEQASSASLTKAYFQVTATAWRDIYAKTDLYSQLYQQRRSIVLGMVDELALPPEARVLEVGCGPGLTTVALAQRGFTVLAVDTAPNLIAMTLALADNSGVGHRISTALCDVGSLAARHEAFDLVVMVGVTEWLDSLQEPMAEIARVMKPGSHLIVTGDNSWALHCVLDPVLNPMLAPLKRGFRTLLQRWRMREPVPVCHLRSIRKLVASFEAAGLRRIRTRTFGFGPFSILKRKPLPDQLGSKVHRALQSLADRGWPILASMGHVSVALAMKPRQRM